MRAAILLTLIIAMTITGGPASCRRENSRSREAAETRTRTPSQEAGASNVPDEGDPFAAIPRLKPYEVARAVKEGRAVVVDIRVAEDYEEEHVKGAISIPLEEIRERGPKELPTDKLIVTYCS